MELLERAGVDTSKVDYDLVVAEIDAFNFAYEVLTQKDVIDFLHTVGVETQYLDPYTFSEILFELGVDTPRLSVDDIRYIIDAQGLTTTATDDEIQLLVDDFNAESPEN